jgi:hypothetical protein
VACCTSLPSYRDEAHIQLGMIDAHDTVNIRNRWNDVYICIRRMSVKWFHVME